ncbi:MAG TPA: response regulator [candidate division CPR3 bacterium]|uniref:Response regulator n=1 Tax=candidate division CPR3 bacterium TaxID=2268181 RepID=A0A7C1NMB0_UNCC3|nr:response regulator [candidate division CPR3 bacterium]
MVVNTILAVEDNPTAMKLIEATVNARAKNKVRLLHAPSIKEAMSLFKSHGHGIDVILMDGEVPSGDGTEPEKTLDLVQWMLEQKNSLHIIAMPTVPDLAKKLIKAGCKEAADDKGNAVYRALQFLGII